MPVVYISGAEYFNRGFDLAVAKEDLLSQQEGRQHSALLQIVAYMTMGKDMSACFNEVSMLSSTPKPTIKRLAYQYLTHYSRLQPEKAVLQAGTYLKDSLSDSPLVRGAAIRTMTNTQVAVMADFSAAPLSRAVSEDESAYVRRAAVYGILKQYSTNPQHTTDSGLLDRVKSALLDTHACVSSAAVHACLELTQRAAPLDLISPMSAARSHFVSLLPGSPEWALYGLLEGIAVSFDPRWSSLRVSTFSPAVHREEEDISVEDDGDSPRGREGGTGEALSDEQTVASVIPYISIDNAAVVFSALKVILYYISSIQDRLARPEVRRQHDHLATMAASTCTFWLTSATRYELRYVVLRNIHVLVKILPSFHTYFGEHFGAFIPLYKDPPYITLEKMEVMMELAHTEEVGRRVLTEILEHVSDSNLEVVRRSVKDIGTLAVKIPELANDCMRELERLIQTGVPRVVEATAVVVQSILRRYPDKQWESVIPALCHSLRVLDQPEAQAAVAWVIGQYPNCLPDALDYLTIFTDKFLQQNPVVQFATLTALVKVYLIALEDHSSTEVLTILESVLKQCSESPIPDLRDRATFYWRMLQGDVSVAKRVIFTNGGAAVSATADGHEVANGPSSEEPTEVLWKLSCLSVILRDPTERRALAMAVDDDAEEAANGSFGASTSSSPVAADAVERNFATPEVELVPGREDCRVVSPTSTRTAPLPSASDYKVVLRAADGNGVQVAMRWRQAGTQVVLSCQFELHNGEDYLFRAHIANLQINRNMFGLGVSQSFPRATLEQGDHATTVDLMVSANNAVSPTRECEVAIEVVPAGVRYCMAPPIPAALLLLPAIGCATDLFVQLMKQMPDISWKAPPTISPIHADPQRLQLNALRVHSLNLVHRKELGDSVALFLHAETLSRQHLLMEVIVTSSVVVLLTVRSPYAPLASYFGNYVLECISTRP